MTTDERIEEVSKKLDAFLTEYSKDKIEANRDKYQNLGYIALGFALGTVGLTVTKPEPATIAVTIILLIIGLFFIGYSGKFKVR